MVDICKSLQPPPFLLCLEEASGSFLQCRVDRTKRTLPSQPPSRLKQSPSGNHATARYQAIEIAGLLAWCLARHSERWSRLGLLLVRLASVAGAPLSKESTSKSVCLPTKPDQAPRLEMRQN